MVAVKPEHHIKDSTRLRTPWINNLGNRYQVSCHTRIFSFNLIISLGLSLKKSFKEKPSNSTFRYIHPRGMKTCLDQNLYINAHGSITLISKKLKQPKCPRIDRQNMVYPYNGIVFGNKKEWSSDLCCNMDKLWKCYDKWKRPNTKGHMLYDCTYIRSHIHRGRQQKGLDRGWGGEYGS